MSLQKDLALWFHNHDELGEYAGIASNEEMMGGRVSQ
jgi:hypothetical protein